MGAQQILDTILNDAHGEAAEIVASAQRAAAAAKAQALGTAKKSTSALELYTERESEEIIGRRLRAAAIDARKNTLAGRRAVLDEAFDAALAKLCALPEKEYAALICRLAAAASESGSEQVLPAAGQSERYKNSLLRQMNAALKAAGKPDKLTLAAGEGQFRGGFMLCGERCDTDCSFESIIDTVRRERESDVFALLFAKEVE